MSIRARTVNSDMNIDRNPSRKRLEVSSASRSSSSCVILEQADAKKKAEEVVELFFDEMSNALAGGDRVEIRGFCSFFVKHYKGYTGRNPKTGKLIIVPQKKLPFFKCGKELKERVDYPSNNLREEARRGQKS